MIATRIATAIAGATAGMVLLSAPSALAADRPTTLPAATQTTIRPGVPAHVLPHSQAPGAASACKQGHHRVTPSQSWAPKAKTPRRHLTHTNHHTGRVVSHRALNIRSGPGTYYRVVGALRPSRAEHVIYKVNGSKVAGNKRWYKLADRRGYVSARYVRNLSYVPWR
ncbi:SH3 domain-containing protein [Streptomyces sp. CdTB01]|uniref:SH3 domain-containing protein n=1 Tax=Streptomyces sp. CdTB01 TaxID=1725411 RepID=UPI00073AC5F5|nr:SH3 domain-containing protein [Streptomyces sp. CdTB01]ALV39205.1 hypothetical protein AS200_44690 [Streptomyces sp. CdTB01]